MRQMRLDYGTKSHDRRVIIPDASMTPTVRTPAHNNIQVTPVQATPHVPPESWNHEFDEFDVTQVIHSLHMHEDPRIRGSSEVNSSLSTEHPNVPSDWPMRTALVFLALASIVSGLVQVYPTCTHGVAKRRFKMKQTNITLVYIPTVALLALWMLMVVMAAAMFVC